MHHRFTNSRRTICSCISSHRADHQWYASVERLRVVLRQSTIYQPVIDMTDSIKAAQTHAIQKDPDRPARRRISYPQLTVLSSIVETSAGRDKTLKCVQYSARTYVYLLKTIIGLHVLKRDHMQRLNQAVGSLSLARFVHILRQDNVERSFKKLIISHTNCQKMHDPILSAYSTHPATTIGRYNGSNKSDSILYRTA
jgi:hypothetical protein